MNTPEFRERMIALGVDPVGNSSAEFRDFLTAEQSRFARMYKLTGLTPE